MSNNNNNNLWKLCNEFDGSKEKFQQIMDLALANLDPNQLKSELADKSGTPEMSVDGWVNGSIVPEPRVRRMVVACVKNYSI